jgi:hypothetical protein
MINVLSFFKNRFLLFFILTVFCSHQVYAEKITDVTFIAGSANAGTSSLGYMLTMNTFQDIMKNINVGSEKIKKVDPLLRFKGVKAFAVVASGGNSLSGNSYSYVQANGQTLDGLYLTQQPSNTSIAHPNVCAVLVRVTRVTNTNVFGQVALLSRSYNYNSNGGDNGRAYAAFMSEATVWLKGGNVSGATPLFGGAAVDLAPYYIGAYGTANSQTTGSGKKKKTSLGTSQYYGWISYDADYSNGITGEITASKRAVRAGEKVDINWKTEKD